MAKAREKALPHGGQVRKRTWRHVSRFLALGLWSIGSLAGGRGHVDSVHVPSLCETTRRALGRIEREAERGWHEPTERDQQAAQEPG